MRRNFSIPLRANAEKAAAENAQGIEAEIPQFPAGKRGIEADSPVSGARTFGSNAPEMRPRYEGNDFLPP
jgi:hypothetical protein